MLNGRNDVDTRLLGPLRLVAGFIGAVLSLTILFVALHAIAAMMNGQGAPAPTLTSSLARPWVADNSGSADVLYDAFAASPGKSLSADVSVTVGLSQARSVPATYRFQIRAMITADAANPLIAAIRRGDAQDQARTVLSLVGAEPEMTWGANYALPTVTLTGRQAKVSIVGSGETPQMETVPVRFRAPNDCSKIGTRQIAVTSSVLTVAAVHTGAPVEDCPLGKWVAQTAGSAVYQGSNGGSLALARTGAPPVSGDQRPLLRVDYDLAVVQSVIGYGVLAALPLLAAWGILTLSLMPGRTARRTRNALSVLLAFHLIVTCGQALASLSSALVERLWRDHTVLFELGLGYPEDTIYAALIVALGYTWRAVSLRTVLEDERRWLQTLVPALLLVASVGSVICAFVVLDTRQRPTITTTSDVGTTVEHTGQWAWSTDWLTTRPGFLVAMIILMHLVTTVALLIAAVSRVPGPGLRRIAWVTPVITTVAIVVVVMWGLAYSPPDDGTAPTTWVEWVFTSDGLGALLAAIVTCAPLAVLPATTIAWSKRAPSRWARRPEARIPALAVAMIGLTLLGGQLALSAPLWSDPASWEWLSTTPTWQEAFTSAPGSTFVLYLFCLASVLAAVTLAMSLGAAPRASLYAASGAGLAILLLMLAPLTNGDGVIANSVGALLPLGASVAVWLTLDRVVRHVLNADPPRAWSAHRQMLRRWRVLRYPLAVVLSVPAVVYGGAYAPAIDWYNFSNLAQSIAGALRLIAVALLILQIRHLGSLATDGSSRGTASQIRRIATLIAVVGLLTPTVTSAGLPIAFILGWVLIELWLAPRPRRPEQHYASGRQAGLVAGIAVRDLARTVVRSRTERALERDLRKSVAEDAPTAAVQNERISRVVRLAVRGPSRKNQPHHVLSGFAGQAPWTRARYLALMGFAVGLPWSIIDASSVMRTLTSGAPFRLVDAADGLLVLLRFALAGLVMGVAYPMIRGNTGLGKGLSLFVTMTGPALVITLLPDPGAEGVLAAAGLQSLQWLAFGLTLGLIMDLQTFRRFGLGWQHLRELHHMNALTASVSSLLVAVITATATAAGTGAAAIFVDRVLTPAPQQQSSAPP